MKDITDLKLSRNMKYEALYWSLGFESFDGVIFKKQINETDIIIDSEKQEALFDKRLSIINGAFLLLTSHKSFVVLECLIKLLEMGYSPSEIIVDLNNEYDIYLKNIYIKCFEWDHIEKNDVKYNKNYIVSICYSSRLVSGIIERETIIKDTDGKIYQKGFFESDSKESYKFYNPVEIKTSSFVVSSSKALKYIGNDSRVVVPDGITELSSCLFWDNQKIEEVILPDSLISLGGDTFYNCSNLKKVNIPKNVRFIGNNPFAGCPCLTLSNNSDYLIYEDGVLFNRDKTRLIYYSLARPNKEYIIPSGVKVIGKHAFYLANNLEFVTLPSSLIKLENNPFSGCKNLKLESKTENYHIADSVIYDKEYKSVIGALNSIKTDKLVLKNIERICRNSFWNCKGIKKIVLPETLKDIGYNPFVGCSHIQFESKSSSYVVEDGILYNKNKSKLICCPADVAVGDIHIKENVIELERGAFSGCGKMTSINLHNVSIISKTCFTNCNSLKEVYCSDLISFIGEWAFAHCESLKKLSVYKECYLDNNILLNTNADLEVRETRSNYVIESDNLYTLNSMINGYQNKIDSIVIDPPYNSKIDNIGYKDSNFENGYISFLKDRLEIAYKLLSDKGYLFINIDKGEYKNIAKLCKTIFRKVKICKWEKLHPYFDINRDVNPNKKKIKFEYIIICSKNKKFDFNKIKQPYIYNGNIMEKEANLPGIFRCFGTNSSAKDELRDIFGSRDYFRTPKPVKLIEEFVRATTNKESIVIDVFAGSGTTGHAVEILNREDGGRRKYILVSNDESNICRDVTLKRMQLINSEVTFLN